MNASQPGRLMGDGDDGEVGDGIADLRRGVVYADNPNQSVLAHDMSNTGGIAYGRSSRSIESPGKRSNVSVNICKQLKDRGRCALVECEQYHCHLRVAGKRHSPWLACMAFANGLQSETSRYSGNHQKYAWYMPVVSATPSIPWLARRATKEAYMPWNPWSRQDSYCVRQLGFLILQANGNICFSSIAINHIQTQITSTSSEKACLFLYFDHKRDKHHTLRDIWSSLLAQLLTNRGHFTEHVEKAFKAWASKKPHRVLNEESRLNSREALNLLTAEMRSFEKIHIVVDALDECPNHGRDET
ncbi:hypothetical protein F4780DRAFT_3998 [Xylariomycetidae sp. FL0641]|nr:hypothetical protein F4780DRAFT_3998 [Xylariomycetidae sp. FL0641]